MRRARWMALLLVLLLGFPAALEVYRDLRYCQKTAEGDAWRGLQEQKTGIDPCLVGNGGSTRVLPAIFALGLAFSLTAVVAFEVKRR